jgi:hypothetical protein
VTVEGYACTLVTQAEATEIAGTPVGEPKAAGATCVFTSPPTGNTAQVGVGPGAKKFLDIQREIGHVLANEYGIKATEEIKSGQEYKPAVSICTG